jgi:hypothetical protein
MKILIFIDKVNTPFSRLVVSHFFTGFTGAGVNTDEPEKIAAARH